MLALALSSCAGPAPTLSKVTSTRRPSAPTAANSPTPQATPTFTATPFPHTPTPTVSFGALERPVFLAWPLPAYVGLARISQYPNSAWSWNYLGLNAGYQCPPEFGYLLNVDSWAYWRDTTISKAQDEAQADPHQFQMVACYSTSGPLGLNGHEGTDIKAEPGTPVYAAADGRVMDWRLTGLNSMLVLKHCLGGTWDADSQCVDGQQWYTTYMHIVPDKALLTTGVEVAQAQQLGTVYDQSINSHLHFEVGLEKRSYTNFLNPWGQNQAPWDGCLWIDQLLCPNPQPEANRMVFATANGAWTIQQGASHAIELIDSQRVKKIRLAGDRIVILDMDRHLFLHDGRYPAEITFDDLADWKLIATDVLDFEISSKRVAMLDAQKRLLINDSGLPDGWLTQAEDVQTFGVSDHRVGYLTQSGDLFVKEGELTGSWTLIQQNVRAFQLTDNRMAVVNAQGVLLSNEGELLSEWQWMANDVLAFQLTNLRLGVLTTARVLQVKDGNLRAPWVEVAQDVQSFQLADYRLVLRGADGVKFQQGNLYQAWARPNASVSEIGLNGTVPVYLP